MIDTWIVVADGGAARIFSAPADFSEFTLLGEHQNKHHAGEHRGRTEKESSHHHEEEAFALELGREITRGVGAHEVRDVVVVAPTRFLSELVGSLPASVAAHLTAKISKDYTKMERHALAERLREVLAESHDAR